MVAKHIVDNIDFIIGECPEHWGHLIDIGILDKNWKIK